MFGGAGRDKIGAFMADLVVFLAVQIYCVFIVFVILEFINLGDFSSVVVAVVFCNIVIIGELIGRKFLLV